MGQWRKAHKIIPLERKRVSEEHVKDWVKSIQKVMKDFCIPEDIQHKIIAKVEKEKRTGDSGAMLYRKAWHMFMEYTGERQAV